MLRLPGKFVWFEHLSPEPQKAREFYEALLGWGCTPMPLPDGSIYQLILRDGRADRPIGGLRALPGGAAPQWLSYLSVDDVDAANAAVLAAGGSSVVSPSDYGMFGRGAVVTDPQGAAFALWRGAFGDPADESPTPAGGWHWNELVTTDADAAVAFYARVFGYTHESRLVAPAAGAGGEPPGRTYHLLKDAQGTPRAGVMDSPDPATPPMWMQYVSVDDCDAAAAKAARLGGKVLLPPTDLPGVGRCTVVSDPVGGALALMKVAR